MSQTISTLAPKIVDSLLRFQSRWVLFHSLRAFGMALRTRKMLETSNYRSSYFFGLITYLFLGFGGSTVAAFLQGTPSTFTSRSELLPIYMIAHALVFHLKSLAPVWSALTWDTPIFVFLGVTRGFSLANSMDAFRSHSMFKGLGAPMSSIPAQILIGLFSSCGSGVMYKWMMEAWNECRSGTGMEVQTIEKKSGEMKRKSKEVKELDDVPVPKTQGLYGHPGFDLNLCLSVAAINVCLTYPIIPLQILENVHSLIPIIPDSLRLLFQSQLSKGEIAVLCTLITSAAPLLKSK